MLTLHQSIEREERTREHQFTYFCTLEMPGNLVARGTKRPGNKLARKLNVHRRNIRGTNCLSCIGNKMSWEQSPSADSTMQHTNAKPNPIAVHNPVPSLTLNLRIADLWNNSP